MTAVSPSLDGMNEWLAFLDRLTCGDRELQDYLQVCSGMEAVGSVYVEKLTVAYGRGGNGKSTFYNAKARAMGDYYGTLSAETLTVNCRKNKSPEYAELRGKRLVIAAELQEGMRLDTAVVKQLCSTDPIQAEKKYKDPFKFLPSHTTVLYTNHLPKVGTNDSGTWDRLVVVPFNARFRGMQGEILNYTEYLLEHCGGVDLSITTDLTAASLLFMKRGDDKKYICQMYWLPADRLAERVQQDKIPYDKWFDRGLLRLCDGNSINYSDVTAWFVETVKQYDLFPAWVYYDSYSARYFVEEMQMQGFNMVRCIQGAKTLSLPMQMLGADLQAHKVIYNNNPVLKWCLTNTGIQTDRNGNIVPIKNQSPKQRIDGTAALLDCYVGLYEHLGEYTTAI